MDTARVVIEVVAGLIPGMNPEPEFTKRFTITSQEWADTDDQAALLKKVNGEAQAYAAELMMRPDRLNWVRTDWIWL